MNTESIIDHSLVGKLCKFIVQPRKMFFYPVVKLIRVFSRDSLWSIYTNRITWTKEDRYFEENDVSLIVDVVTKDNSTTNVLVRNDYILLYDNKFWATKRSNITII
jgi:hypothetical protein